MYNPISTATIVISCMTIFVLILCVVAWLLRSVQYELPSVLLEHLDEDIDVKSIKVPNMKDQQQYLVVVRKNKTQAIKNREWDLLTRIQREYPEWCVTVEEIINYA